MPIEMFQGAETGSEPVGRVATEKPETRGEDLKWASRGTQLQLRLNLAAWPTSAEPLN